MLLLIALSSKRGTGELASKSRPILHASPCSFESCVALQFMPTQHRPMSSYAAPTQDLHCTLDHRDCLNFGTKGRP